MLIYFIQTVYSINEFKKYPEINYEQCSILLKRKYFSLSAFHSPHALFVFRVWRPLHRIEENVFAAVLSLSCF